MKRKRLNLIVFLLYLLIFPAFFSVSIMAEEGSVMGINDAIKNFRRQDATRTGNLNEIRREYQELNQVKNEINRDVSRKEQEMNVKYKEMIENYLDRWINYLNKVKEQLVNSDDATLSGYITSVEAEIAWVEGKKAELQSLTNVDDIKIFTRELRTQRQAYIENFGEIRSQFQRRYLERLRVRLTNMLSLVERMEMRISLFAQRGLDVTQAHAELSLIKEELNNEMAKLDNGDVSNSELLVKEVNLLIKKTTTQLRVMIRQLRLQIATGADVTVTLPVR